MLWESEEETFKRKPKRFEERVDESKINAIMKRLELITQQVNLISKYLSNVSKRVGEALEASVAYQRDLDDLERRIKLIKSRMEELENIVPEVEMKKFGRKAG